MSTRVTLDLTSSTNSSIMLRKMSANIQKVQKALQDLRGKNIVQSVKLRLYTTSVSRPSRIVLKAASLAPNPLPP
jgi:hypothetical protein